MCRKSAAGNHLVYCGDAVVHEADVGGLVSQVHIGSLNVDGNVIPGQKPYYNINEILFSLGIVEKDDGTFYSQLVLAYDSGGYGMKEIGYYFGLHYSRVSRIISGLGRAKDKS